MRASNFFAIACLIVSAPSTSLADEAGARAAKERADALEKEGKIEASCKMRENADQEAPNFRRKWAIGLCYEKLGKTATAWLKFDAALDFVRVKLQLNPNDFEAKAQEQQAKPKVDDIAKHVPKIRIHVADKAPGLTVLRGAEPVSEGLFDTDIAVDPGPIVITASAPNFVTFSTTISAEESSVLPVNIPALACEGSKHRTATGCGVACGANETWTGQTCECAVNFERIGGQCVVACLKGEVRDEGASPCHKSCSHSRHWDGNECVANDSTESTEPPSTGQTPPPEQTQSSGKSQGIPMLTWVFGGVGVASLAAAGVFTGLAEWKWGRAKVNGCDSLTKVCTTQLSTDEQHDAQTFGNVATATLIGGLALVGVGVTIWLTSGSGKGESGPKTSLVLAPNGFQIVGRF